MKSNYFLVTITATYKDVKEEEEVISEIERALSSGYDSDKFFKVQDVKLAELKAVPVVSEGECK